MAKKKSLNWILTLGGLGAIGVGIWYLLKKRVSASIGNVMVTPSIITRGTAITITSTVLNTGSKSATFYVGCSIIAPNGDRTDSKDFCCGSWNGTTCSTRCNITPEGFKTIQLDSGQSGIVSFTENIGPLAQIGQHEVLMAVYKEGATTWEDKLGSSYAMIQISG